MTINIGDEFECREYPHQILTVTKMYRPTLGVLKIGEKKIMFTVSERYGAQLMLAHIRNSNKELKRKGELA